MRRIKMRLPLELHVWLAYLAGTDLLNIESDAAISSD